MMYARSATAALMLTLPLSWLAADAHAVILTVGSDAACQHASVQSAINALPAGGTHEIRVRNGTYSQQAVAVAGRVLTLIGGYADCTQTASTGTSILSGQGGGADSVLTITGSGNDIIVQNLSLIRGDEVSDGYGGGIDFRGTGYLTLRNAAITQNGAGYGGGVSFVASGGAAELRIESDTSILLNTAQVSGGGIRLEGDARLLMTQDRIVIGQNEAVTGYGGGILVLAPATADIGSPGLGGTGVINNNRARYGGGLALYAADDSGHQHSVRLFTTNANRPVRIHDNVATNTGGGIYLFSDWEFVDGSLSSLYAYDFRIDGNSAQEGSAIYADMNGNSAGRIFLNGGLDGLPRPAELGAVACAPGVRCNLIEDNIAQTTGGSATTGAAVLVQDRGSFGVDRVAFTGNVGGQVLRSFGRVDMYNSLIAGNAVTQNLIRQEGVDNTVLRIENTTIAGNVIGAAHVISSSEDVRFRRSVLWQPGKTSLTQSGGTRDVGDLVVSERMSLDGGSTPFVVEADPRFVDPARGDFHPRAASPAIDFASTGGGFDLDGAPRGGDLPIVANLFGSGDLGAYERPSLQPLVLNGDLDADLNLWQDVTAGASSWTNAQNAVGAAGSGSIAVSMGDIPQDRITVRTQCIHLPGPGRYRLNGWGRSAGTIASRDSVLLHWQLRRVGQESCNAGPPDLSGDHFLSTSAGWVRPATPATIEISETDWTWTSSITIELAVIDNGITFPPAVTGWFDGITLDVDEGDVIFADDFEP